MQKGSLRAWVLAPGIVRADLPLRQRPCCSLLAEAAGTRARKRDGPGGNVGFPEMDSRLPLAVLSANVGEE